ncbi:MAG: serine/threonine protein kinase [Rubrivivax sp.]|nr:serine/threonine protein kinase [Rubrivivax sp.]
MSSASSPTASATPLPPGTRLVDFEVRDVVGVGGFGIVYRAFDHTLERDVALKEYMPSALADRTATMHVSLRSSSSEETFKLGLKSFINEARLLARFDHPSLVKVYRFWEANGTAYMVMPLYRGRTLKDMAAEGRGPKDEASLRKVLMPLLGALERLHDDGVYHRDISPDNIVIEPPDGHPVLLDFGAARHVIGDRSQHLTAILKPSYAPIEQYAEAGGVKQGPWTDFYALGATLHYLLRGKAPPPATARAIEDTMVPLASQPAPGCSVPFLRVIDWMLSPRPADRPKSALAIRDALAGRSAAPSSPAAAAPPRGDSDATVVLPPRSDLDDTLVVPRGTNAPAPRSPAPSPMEATMVMPRPAAPKGKVAATQTVMEVRRAAGPPPSAAPAPFKPRRPSWLVAALIAGGAVGAGALWWAVAGRSGQAASQGAPGAAAVAASAPAGDLAGSDARVVSPGATVPTATEVATSTPTAPTPAPAPEPTAPAPAPMTSATTAPAGSPPAVPLGGSPAPVAARKPPPKAPAPAVPTYSSPAPAPAPVPVPTPIEAAPPPVARTPAPTPAPRQAAPAPTVIPNPRETCGSRVLMALWNCMSRECAKPEVASHPECVKWLEMRARQRNAESQ